MNNTSSTELEWAGVSLKRTVMQQHIDVGHFALRVACIKWVNSSKPKGSGNGKLHAQRTTCQANTSR